MATYVTTKRAALLMKRTTQSIYLMKRKNRVKWIMLGNRILYEKESLMDYEKKRWDRQLNLSPGEWTINDAANYFGCPNQRIYHMIRKKKIPFEKRGALFILDPEKLKKINEREPEIFRNLFKKSKVTRNRICRHDEFCHSDANSVRSKYARALV